MNTGFIVDIRDRYDLWVARLTGNLNDSGWMLESDVERWLYEQRITYHTLRNFALVFLTERDQMLFTLRWM